MTTNLRRSPDLPTSLPPNLEFVFSLSPAAMTLGLGNIQKLLARLGSPQRSFRSIVVAGTNGKGSVTSMLASILAHNGLRVGRFTSPHVYSVTERVCVDGKPVTLDDMEAAAEAVVALRDELTFSYFEAVTAIAFLIFAARGVEYAVLETGLGGRFDATNAVEPVLSVITGVSLDHRRILGDSEEEILREKLGITRPAVPLLVGPVPDSLREIIEEKASRDGFPVAAFEDLGIVRQNGTALDKTAVRIRTASAEYGTVDLPFPGAHQFANALLAVGAAERIVSPLENVREALSRAYLPGRFETVVPHPDWMGNGAGNVRFILDVAHNDEALVAAADHLARCSPRMDNAMVLGLMRRKELFEFPRRVWSAVGRVYAVSPGTGDALSPPELFAKYLNSCFRDSGTDVMVWNRTSAGGGDDWTRLIGHLVRSPRPFRRVLVTGSHHVVDEFGRRLLAPAEYR
jgi:dihydrofolate synthase/folylpolyglutamate synthase